MNIIENPPHWHIAGIGALGSLFAGYFYHAGQAITLILKNEHQLKVYQTTQLSVITDCKTVTGHPKAITTEQLGTEPIPYLLCCVKAGDVSTLLMQLKPNLTENSVIVLIHNGVGVLDEIPPQVPPLRIVLGVCTVGSYLEKPFTTRAFLDGEIQLGSLIGQLTPHEIKMICDAFQTTDLPYQWEKNIQRKMWNKFAINCCINVLTALFNCKNGELIRYESILKELTNEVAHVLKAHGFCMTTTELYSQVRQAIKNTANNFSSMYSDVQQKKPSELHYLNEQLVKLALQKNIATPCNNELLKQFHAKFPWEKKFMQQRQYESKHDQHLGIAQNQ